MVCILMQDHPRRCGENMMSLRPRQAIGGSPPQVRGKQRILTYHRPSRRITPAGAGKTTGQKATQWRLEDHPRRCGENRYVPDRRQRGIGSPPQVRGKPFITAWARYKTRITPAGAGKTWRMYRISSVGRDHPRRCGENAVFTFGRVHCRGSPPQVRGKLLYQSGAIMSRRITPAGAGKTGSGIVDSCNAWDHPRRCGENNLA